MMNPPLLCRQKAFNINVHINDLEISDLQESNKIEHFEEILDFSETIYRGFNSPIKASSYSNLEKVSKFNNKISLIKKFNSF